LISAGGRGIGRDIASGKQLWRVPAEAGVGQVLPPRCHVLLRARSPACSAARSLARRCSPNGRDLRDPARSKGRWRSPLIPVPVRGAAPGVSSVCRAPPR
jgi:hypothetical protein